MALTKIKPDVIDETLDYSFDNVAANTLSVSTDVTLSGNTSLQQSIEKLQTITGATGTVTHNFSLGSLFYHSSISANFTANITNVPSTNDRVIVVSLILLQGSTSYIPNALQINGTSQTINWSNGVAPTGNANKRDLVVFSLVRTSSTWTILGQLSTFG
jgi:hypothetical protein